MKIEKSETDNVYVCYCILREIEERINAAACSATADELIPGLLQTTISLFSVSKGNMTKL